jgi:glycosyltransferase involved in cell wall biosynthesis
MPVGTPPLRVGFDVTALEAGLTGGTTMLVYNLVRGLALHPARPTLELLYARRPGTAADPLLAELTALGDGRVRVHHSRFVHGGLPIRGGETWRPTHPTVRALIGDVDVFHASDFVWPTPDGTPQVISVLDLTTRLFPEHHFWPNRFRHWRKLRWAQQHAQRFQVISAATGADLHRELGISTDRIDVIPLARAHALTPPTAALVREVRTTYGIGDAPFILCTGTIEPRKNHARLIAAFDRIAADYPTLRLVLAGGRGWKMRAIDTIIANASAATRIHKLGFVPAAALDVLYAEATVFAYPSLYEGFGLPLLEAMAAGTPVLTSNVSSLPEVAGDAAVLCDPTSVDAIASGLRQLLDSADLRATLSARGRERERTFTWERTADLTMQSYLRTLGRHTP